MKPGLFGTMVPSSWSLRSLGELVQEGSDSAIPSETPNRPYIGMEHIESGTGRVIALASPNDYRSSSYVAKPNQVLYGRLRPYLNKVFIPNREVYASREFIPLTPGESLNSHYLLYLLRSSEFVNYAMSLNSGDRPRVKWQQMESCLIPAPPPDEQDEIVRILEEQFSRLDAAAASIAAVRRKADQFRRSALFQSLMGEGQPDSGSEGRGDSGWLSGELGDFCEMYQPRTISTKQLVAEGAYPVFGANGMIGRYNEYNHEESEVTVTCRGATCGTVNVTPAKCWITGNSMVVRPKDSQVSQPYLKYVLSALDFSQVITGTAQPQITRASLSRAKVRFAPIGQQSVIVALLDAAESDANALSAMAETTEVRLVQLRRSLLHAAFSGELTRAWREKNNG